jgi:hypothetical protein
MAMIDATKGMTSIPNVQEENNKPSEDGVELIEYRHDRVGDISMVATSDRVGNIG